MYPTYIEDSYKENKFLDEIQYEVQSLNKAARHCRLNPHPFLGKIFYVQFDNNSEQSEGLRSILKMGGGQVYNFARKNYYFFGISDKSKLESFQAEIGHDREIIDMAYIKDVLFEV